MNLKRIIFVISVLAIIFVPAHATSLKFEKSSNRLTRDSLTSQTVDFVFQFTNVGVKPIRITKVDRSCTCTDVVVPEGEFKPGEQGSIVGFVDLSKRQGNTSASLHVYSSDSADPTTLTFSIPATGDLVAIEAPRFLIWKKGEPALPKRVAVTLRLSAGVSFTGIEVKGDGFSAKLISDKADREKYWVEIQPVATTAEAHAIIQPSDAGLKRFSDQLRIYAAIFP